MLYSEKYSLFKNKHVQSKYSFRKPQTSSMYWSINGIASRQLGIGATGMKVSKLHNQGICLNLQHSRFYQLPSDLDSHFFYGHSVSSQIFDTHVSQ